MPKIACRGETLNVVTAGSGPTLLLVHSLGTGAWLWRREIAEWSRWFTVVAADARGHGGSSNRGGFTVADVAADILAVAREVAPGPIHLLGISMGGPICAHVVAQAGGEVASLVIAASFAHLGAGGAMRADAAAMAIRKGTMQAFGERYAEETLMPATRPIHGAELAASLAAMTPDDYLQAARAVFTADVRAQLGAVACPAHIVVGTEDKRTPPGLSEEINGLIRHARLETIEGAGHLANLDQPERFEAAVLPFLRAQAGV